jgi:hypothetical protein
MAKAFKCDHCKELTEKAQSDDVFYPKRVRIDIKYGHPVSAEPFDLCLGCRVELLKFIIKGIEAKQKYTWGDLKHPEKVVELL